LTEGATLAQQGATPITTTPFSQQAVDQYMSPYQSDVINSTMALENQQDAQQQQSLAGNITAAGAWGGDRSAVLQSQLAGQQALANNSTNANLENQGYTQALNQFNTQNQQSLQTQEANNQNAQAAGYELGSLGSALQNNALSGANSLLSAGTVAQNTAQNQDTAGYEQYLQQQAYPYQSLDFLASLLPGIAQGTGITSTGQQSTSPTLFGIPVKDGGRVSLARGGLATGGLPYGSESSLSIPMPNVPNFGTSYVPSSAPSGGGMSLSGAGGSGGDMGGQGGNTDGLSLGSGAVGSFLWGSPATASAGASSGLLGSGGMSATMSDLGSSLGDAILAMFKAGGRTHLADGGQDDSSDDVAAADAIIGSLAPQTVNQSPAGASALSLADTPAAWRGQVTNYAQPDSGTSLADASPTWDDGTPVSSDAGTLSNPNPQPHEIDTGHEASIWPAILAGVGGLFTDHPIANAIGAGLGEWEKDNHPDVDHSGPTTVVRYADGSMIDTGIPTEAAINAKSMADYRNANLQMNEQTREDAIAERAQAAQEAVAERQEAAQEAAQNRAMQLRIAQMNADQGRYQWQPGTQIDPTTKQPVAGMWRLPTRGGEAPTFVPDANLTQKQSIGGGPQLSPDAIKNIAGQYIAGDRYAITSLGYGSQGAANRAAVWNEISDQMKAQGASPIQIAERQAEFAKSAGAFATGQQGNAIRSFNVGLTHLDTLGNLVGALGNGDVRLLNSAKNAFQSQFGAPAPTNFNAAKAIVADEIVKAIVGSGGSEADREKAQATINSANSPAQLAGVINTYKTLMAGQLGGLKQQYEATTGLNDFNSRLSPAAQRVFAQHYQSPSPSTHFENGQVYRDANGNRARYLNGQWQPVP